MDSHNAPTLTSKPPREPEEAEAGVRPASSLPQVAVDEAPLRDSGFDERYHLERLLGRGGMGEVRLSRDRRLGRFVAVKVSLAPADSAELLARFLREARVQGQLEHPSIVPVYDLGEGPSGAPYFTMKRVQGVALDEVIRGLRGKDPEFERFTRHRLLSAFGSVCLAVGFAHSRGVVHRDLKPANIMLGDFGEVYVLDWGLAKLVDARPEAPAISLSHSAIESWAGKTSAGALLGTPGYMSPEQCLQPSAVGPATDIYALGAILFELLTLQPLHAGGDPMTLIQSTLNGANARAAERAPECEVPPELEAICVTATARKPGDRFQAATEISGGLERFLEGLRDEDLRRQTAERHAASAREAADRAFAGGEGAEGERRRAMREVGRAIALNPGNQNALRTLVRLFSELPEEVPGEALAEERETWGRYLRTYARAGGLSYLLLFAYVPLFLWMGVLRWGEFGWVFGSIGVGVLMSVVTVRWLLTDDAVVIASFINAVIVGASSLLFGPFLVLPGFAAVTTLAFALALGGWRRLLAIGLGCASVLLPVLLEWAGLLPPSYAFTSTGMQILPRMVMLERTPTIVVLVVTSLTTLVIAAVAVGTLRDALRAAQRKLLVQAWQLRQLMPEGTLSEVTAPPSPAGSPRSRSRTG